MTTWELLPKYAEQSLIYIEADSLDEASSIASDLASRRQASGGYLPGGALEPTEVRENS